MSSTVVAPRSLIDRRTAVRSLFGVTSFANAFLLFLIQPLIAKRLLPIFGGSPVVWSTSLLFFQLVLVLGYAYAHKGSRLLSARWQAPFHLALLVLGALALPIKVPEFVLNSYRSAVSQPHPGLLGNPAVAVLLLLAVSIGLPFLGLSAGSPLIQRWYSRSSAAGSDQPYFLYRASNWGSILALLVFPLILEPSLTLSEVSAIWSLGYISLLGLLLACGLTVSDKAQEALSTAASLSLVTKARWALLAAGPTLVLIGGTAHLTTNVAPIPLLWMVPLIMYLGSYIVAFHDRWQPRLGILHALVGAAGILFVGLAIYPSRLMPIGVIVAGHLAILGLVSLASHSAAAKIKPGSEHLTDFYLMLSVGGAVGGLFGGLIAPAVFNGLYEYPLGIAIASAALAWVRATDRNRFDFTVPLGSAALLSLLRLQWPIGKESYYYILAAVCLIALSLKRPIMAAGLTSLMLILLVGTAEFGLGDSLVRSRNFFGALAVRSNGRVNRLSHGNTLHGAQDREMPREPMLYYTRESGVGLAMTAFQDVRKVGMVGLGVGTLATYGRAGQQFDFYEIDPAVVEIAENPKLFTYLADSKAETRVILGDARLRLNEASDRGYGLLILDAFSSDAIPTHLLTREAISLYLSKLDNHGVLVFHISNRYVRLQPVLAAHAAESGLVAYQYVPKSGSDWVVLARRKEDLQHLLKNPGWKPIDLDDRVRTWTDDYTDLRSILKLAAPS